MFLVINHILSGGKSTGTGTEYPTGNIRFIHAVSGTPAKGCTCAVMNPVPEPARAVMRYVTSRTALIMRWLCASIFQAHLSYVTAALLSHPRPAIFQSSVTMPRWLSRPIEDKLKESREGISISPEDMTELDNLVSPLLMNGHSISSVFINHEDEIPVSERTLYSYVNNCRLTARSIDMPRKVHFKQRYKHDNSRNREPFAIGRTYKNFKDYIYFCLPYPFFGIATVFRRF